MCRVEPESGTLRAGAGARIYASRCRAASQYRSQRLLYDIQSLASRGSPHKRPSKAAERVPAQKMVASRRTFSPPLSVVTTETHAGHAKLNIVSRLVIEGKAKRDADKSRVRLFMKVYPLGVEILVE